MECDLQFLHVAFADFYNELWLRLVRLSDEMKFDFSADVCQSNVFFYHCIVQCAVKIVTCNDSNYQQSIPFRGCKNCSSTMSPTGSLEVS